MNNIEKQKELKAKLVWLFSQGFAIKFISDKMNEKAKERNKYDRLFKPPFKKIQ
jgi:hypothetical protein